MNLFIASELSTPDWGLTLRQETNFPDEEHTALIFKLTNPKTFTVHLRYPSWVAPGAFVVKVNGQPTAIDSGPSSYVEIRREWHDGDRVEIELPMRTTVESLPDGSDWYAILHGPILLAAPSGTEDLDGLYAGSGRGDHIPSGPYVALDKMPVLLSSAADVPKHVVSDTAAGPLHFRLTDIADPPSKDGIPPCAVLSATRRALPNVLGSNHVRGFWRRGTSGWLPKSESSLREMPPHSMRSPWASNSQKRTTP